VFKGAIISLATMTISAEVRSQQSGISANISRYLLVGFLTLLLSVTFYLEKLYNSAEDSRKESDELIKKIGELQSAAISYLFTAILPAASNNEVLDIIERFPSVLGMITIGSVRKSVGDGFNVVADAMTTIQSSFNDLRSEFQQQIDEHVIPLKEILRQIIGDNGEKPPAVDPTLLPKEIR